MKVSLVSLLISSYFILLCVYLSVRTKNPLFLFIIINGIKEISHIWRLYLILSGIILFLRSSRYFQTALWMKGYLWFTLLGRKIFKDCAFLQLSAGAQLKRFIYDILNEWCCTLVRMFYSNLNYIDEVITSKLKKHRICLSLKEFTTVCNLPCTSSDHDNDK